MPSSGTSNITLPLDNTEIAAIIAGIEAQLGAARLSLATLKEATDAKIMIAAERTKLSGIEAGADAADATNVAAAGAVMDSDITPDEGILRKTGAGTYTAHKSNLAATTAPGVNSDGVAGYSVGSIWLDTTADNGYVCIDASTGAAIWLLLMTPAQVSKLSGIEAGADATDATNVAAAGAVMDSDITPDEGILRKTGAGTYTAHKSNLAATTAPGVNSDGVAGYSVGSIWLDTTADNGYVCIDASTGAAIWLLLMTPAQVSKLSGIEASADVTDAANVAAAGAAILLGKAGGQKLYGGTAASENLELESTSNGTKGLTQVTGNLKITGNLTVQGTTVTVESDTVEIGDSEITLNSDIATSAENSYGGVSVKRVIAASAYTVSNFVASTKTINVTSDPTGTLAAGDLIFISGSVLNNGLYEVDSVSSSTIVILATSTVPGAVLELLDETIAAKVNEAAHAYYRWDENNDCWVFGYYAAGAVKTEFKAVGIGAGGVAAFSSANPDLSAQGTSAANSGAQKIGIFDSVNTNVQDALAGIEKTVLFSWTNTGGQSVVDLPANAYISSLILRVATPVTVDKTMSVGWDADPDGVVTEAQITAAAGNPIAAGDYEFSGFTAFKTTAAKLLVTMVGSPAAGAGQVFAKYSVPNT